MMKRLFYIFLCIPLTFSAQILSLEECQQKANKNYPLIKQYELISLSEKYTLENIAKVYLPKISLNGQATYQTDVTELPFKNIPSPNNPILTFTDFIPTMSKDQYKITVDAQQLIWDGGNSKTQSNIVKANTEVEKSKTEVSLYAITEKINQIYFGILSIDEQIKQLELLNSELQTNYNLVQAMLKNGLAMQSDLDQIQIEFLNLEQKKTELLSNRAAFINMLSLFTNENLNADTKFIIPEDSGTASEEIIRPELTLFSKQQSLMNAQVKTVKSKNMPVIGLFAQGGYGKPGLNFLEPKFKLFAIGGVKVSWGFGNLYTKKNEKELIQVNKNSIDIQKQTFLFNTRIRLNQLKPEIEKYKVLMQKDHEIIVLRNRVKTTSQSKYKNGVYQINDLIRDITAENQARQTKSLHYIQYLLSIYNYKYTLGN